MARRPQLPPPRPPAWEETVGGVLFRALAPRTPRQALPPAPEGLRPYEELALARSGGPGELAATWFPTTVAPRGAVLLLHPWLIPGRAYFYRGSRITPLRQVGYDVLAPDLPGFGRSGAPRGFYDRAVADALGALRARAGGLPTHVWGVSSGGYWAHPVLSAGDGVAGAFFEDVSPHLHEWAWRMVPWGRPLNLLFRLGLPRAYRFLDMRRHAAAHRAAAVAYLSGARDRGVRPEDTIAFAAAAGARARIVPEADHLGSIKVAPEEVLALALAVFREAEERRAATRPAGERDAPSGCA